MIKEGDKLVCIKDYNSCIFDVINQRYIKDKIYEIKKIDTESVFGMYAVYVEGEMKGDRKSWFNEKTFSKYFIPLAEWREKQIKSVLDE